MRTACISTKEPARALAIAAGDRSEPIILCREIRYVLNLEQTSRVYCVEPRETAHSWHTGCASNPILCTCSPKQPYPESTWVTLYLRDCTTLSYQELQYGMTAFVVRLRPALDSWISLLWLSCALFMASALITHIILLGMPVSVERILRVLLYIMALVFGILRYGVITVNVTAASYATIRYPRVALFGICLFIFCTDFFRNM